jgi:hypothetical protein
MKKVRPSIGASPTSLARRARIAEYPLNVGEISSILAEQLGFSAII